MRRCTRPPGICPRCPGVMPEWQVTRSARRSKSCALYNLPAALNAHHPSRAGLLRDMRLEPQTGIWSLSPVISQCTHHHRRGRQGAAGGWFPSRHPHNGDFRRIALLPPAGWGPAFNLAFVYGDAFRKTSASLAARVVWHKRAKTDGAGRSVVVEPEKKHARPTA